MTLPYPFVLASGNVDKVREICEIIADTSDEPVAAWALNHDDETYAFLLDAPERIGESVATHGSLVDAPDVEETGTSLEENARIKARALGDALGTLACADDTGLEVDALGGAPGVYSARYAGERATYDDNVAKLLRELENVDDRRARFATVALARWPDGHEVVRRGEVAGRILVSPRGTAGFGYDPVFVPDEGDGRTFAEMTPDEKHSVSHRGRAFRALVATLIEKG
jgi:XTP/dITP diphosphohydrolase